MRTDRLDLTADEAWRTYTLLTRVETAFRDLKTPLQMRPIYHRSWATLRDALRTHQTLTTVLPSSDGHELHLRNASVPEPAHRALYQALGIPAQIMRPVRTWVTPNSSSDESSTPPPQTKRKARKSG
jgi:hypothetical protein